MFCLQGKYVVLATESNQDGMGMFIVEPSPLEPQKLSFVVRCTRFHKCFYREMLVVCTNRIFLYPQLVWM